MEGKGVKMLTLRPVWLRDVLFVTAGNGRTKKQRPAAPDQPRFRDSSFVCIWAGDRAGWLFLPLGGYPKYRILPFVFFLFAYNNMYISLNQCSDIYSCCNEYIILNRKEVWAACSFTCSEKVRRSILAAIYG